MTVVGIFVGLVVLGVVSDRVSDYVHHDTVEEFYHGDID